MICPKCKTSTLEQRTTFDSWSAYEPPSCSHCHGMWLSKEVLARLIDDRPALVHFAEVPGKADRVVGLCPEGHGELIRAGVETTPRFHLDRCPVCHGIWFDGGEWQQLASRHMLRRLDEIWTSAWQERLRALATEEELKSWGTEAFGQRLFALLETVGTEIRQKKLRAKALAYLRERTRGSG